MNANQLPRADRGTDSPRDRPPAVTPREALLEHLHAAGGQLAERRLVTEVPYGTDACRRVLGELATAGRVERRAVGPETVVYASDARPATSRPDAEHPAD